MKKIISLFQRDFTKPCPAQDIVTPGAEWVIAGEGVATRKWDGTCCMIRNGKLFKRYDAKRGKTPPEGFEPAQEPDAVTGHWPGWVEVGDGPEDKRHREAFAARYDHSNGTYELCGPGVNGNPELFPSNVLIRHGNQLLSDCPSRFEELRDYLAHEDVEGIVWHHPDGRMVKLKKKDFGFKR